MNELIHSGAAAGAAFMASLVEAVEALTVVLAVGSVRGWRDALTGTGAAILTLLILTALFGPSLTLIPLRVVQLVVGGLLLLFGLRWLRKAILRSAGVLALHDEDAAFAETRQAMAVPGGGSQQAGFDPVAFTAAYKIVMLEGVEVVFIVIAVSAGGPALILPAALGAVAAALVVVLLGLIVHQPLSKVPENTLKLVVGVMLSAFGAFWLGEGLGVAWPGADAALIGLIALFALTAALGAPLARSVRR